MHQTSSTQSSSVLMVGQTSRGHTVTCMHEPLRRVVAAFGAERCVWGSDFPQALWTPGTSYDQYVKLFTEELGLKEDEKNAIMGGTALKLWFDSAGKLL